MGSVTYDTELMTNYVAGVPVAGGSHFATCLDPVSRKVVVFALSNDETPKLQMIKEDANGTRHAHDLTEALRIPKETPIQTFEVQQGSDLSVYLAVATKYDDKHSNLLLVRPFRIQDKPSIELLPVKTVESVHRIYMNAPAEEGRYPMVLLTQQPLGDLTKGSDIKRVLVSLPSNSWYTLRDMQLPFNASDIFSIAPAHSDFGEGLFVLCAAKDTGEPALVAEFVDDSEEGPPQWYTVKLKCPTGARSLAPYNDSDRFTALLVACDDGIRHFTADQATNKEATSTLISSDSAVKNAERIVLAQDNESISLWTSNQKGALSFLTTTVDEVTNGDHAVIPLLTDGRANTFSACIARPTPGLGRPCVFQAIIANDSQGNLTLLQQHRDTGIWKDEPFYVSYKTKNIKFDSHTVTIHLMHKGQPLAGGQIYLSSSSATSALVNGKVVQCGSIGTWLSADEAGDIALIFSASSIAGQALNLTQMKDSEGHDIDFSSTLIDPNDKFITALGKLTSVKQLKESTTRSGKPLWDPKSMPSDKDLEAAVKCFGAINEAAKTLPKDGKPMPLIKSANMAALQIVEGRVQATQSLGDILMEGFYWIRQQIDNVVDWIVQKAGDVWHFVCTIGNAVKKFVLDSVEKIGEAATWVFEKIKLGWEKVKEFIGFIFSWDDILDTKNTLSSIVNSGLDFAIDEVDGFVPKVDDLFNLLKDQVVKALSPPSRSVSGREAQGSTGKIVEIQNSASFKWAGERLKNGGTGTGGAELKGKDKSSPDDTWGDTVEPLLNSISTLATQTGNDLALLFKKQGSVTTQDLLTTGSHFLAGALEVVKQFAISVLKLVKKLLNVIKDLGNYKIELPIFTWLYYEITGHDLTLFDAVCFIIAIPATLLIKVITGKAPPKIPNMNGKLLGQLITGSKDVSPATKADFNTLTAGTMVSVVVIKNVFGLIQLAYKSATGGTDGAVGAISPGKAIKAICLVIDIVGAIAAIRGNPKLPAPHLRQWITYLSLYRAAINGMGLVIPTNEAIDKLSACVNLAITLANYGLYQAVYYYELTEEWEDKDDEGTGLSVVNNVLNTLAGVGTFTANIGKLEQPEITFVGVMVMTAGKYGLTIMEGVVFEEKYRKRQETRFPPPSF